MYSFKQIKKYVLNWRYLAGAALIVTVLAGMAVIAQTESSLSAKSPETASTSQEQLDNTNQNNQVAAANQGTNAVNQDDQLPTSSSTTTPSDNTSKPINQPHPYSNPEKLFTDLRLSAESVIVWNQAENEIIYGHQSRKEQPLASITKLMTALVARENTTASTTATVGSQHLDAVGEYGLQADETWPIDQLITFMLVRSANDAARAVASATTDAENDGYASKFVDMMNQTANRLGLEDTYFFNPSGLDINEELISGGYSTAYDTVRLFDYITSNHPNLLAPTTKKTVRVHTSSGNQYTAENTNEDISAYSNSYGSKTGYTVLAGGNLVMGFQLQEPVVIAVFGSTKNGRFTDMQQLHQATKQYLSITD